MKRLTLLTLSLTAVACGVSSDPADEFRAASPSRQSLTLGVGTPKSKKVQGLGGGPTSGLYPARPVTFDVTSPVWMAVMRSLSEGIARHCTAHARSNSTKWPQLVYRLARCALWPDGAQSEGLTCRHDARLASP